MAAAGSPFLHHAGGGTTVSSSANHSHPLATVWAGIARTGQSAPVCLALLLLTIAAIQFLAWQFDLEVLRRPLPVFPAIFPWTICGFLALAVILLLLAAGADPRHKGGERIAKVLAVIIALVASAFLLEYVLARPVSRFDELLFKPILFKAGGSFPGRPAPQTCCTFVLLCVSVWVFDRKGKRRIEAFQIAVACAMFLPALAVLGYLLFATVFLSLGGSPTTEMAIPTLLLFCVSGAAFFSLFPREGLVGLAFQNDLAGKTVQRLVPLMVVVPLASGWALYYVTMRWHWRPQLSIAVYVLVLIALLLALSLEIGSLIRRHEADQQVIVIERERQIAVQASLLLQLRRSNEALEDFAAVAAHDLQEPLRSMAGCAQILERKYAGRLDHGADELIAFIVDGSARMKSLIEDLLVFSQAGKAPGLDTIDVKEALQEALARLASAVREAHAEIVLDGLPSSVRFGKGSFVQILQNLIGNAVKYRGETTPRVVISGRRQGNAWVFTVADNGIGFDPQYSEDVFGVFKRLHHRADYPGTGLGLAIVRKTVEQRGGKIWAESAIGKGTRFSFSVPDDEPAEGKL